MFSPVQRASVPSRSFTHASLVRPRGLHHAIVTHSTGHREKLRLCSRARQIGRALGSENEAYFNVCFSREANRVSDFGLGKKKKEGMTRDRRCCICYGTCMLVDMICIPEEVLRTS